MNNEKDKKPGETHEEKLENRVFARQLSRKLTQDELNQVSGARWCTWITHRDNIEMNDIGSC